MTISILLILIVAVGAALIAVILVQQTQTGGLSAFTGGASGSVFGAKGSTGFLFKLTAALMIAFAVLCVLVANVAGKTQQQDALNALTTEQAPAAIEASDTPAKSSDIPSLDAGTSDATAPPALDAEVKPEAKKEETETKSE